MTGETIPQDTLRLTQYASGGGCACKVPPGELERVLAGLPVAAGLLARSLLRRDDPSTCCINDVRRGVSK